jgi:hypothetical protein
VAAIWSGARMAGSGFSSRAAVGTARVGAWNGARWNGANLNHGSFRHGRFVHRHGRVFFVGGGPWWVGGSGSRHRGDFAKRGSAETTATTKRGDL